MSIVQCIVSNVSNLIAFTAIFSFLDAVVAWFFIMLDIENAGFKVKLFITFYFRFKLTFLKTILQYLFWPIAFMMGVPHEDCLAVAKLVGLKTFINEFIAYKELGQVINFRKEIIANNQYELYRNGTLNAPSNIAMIWNVRMKLKFCSREI